MTSAPLTPDAAAPVLVAGPTSWNELVYVAELPEPRPQTVFADRHRATVGGTSAGKALNLRSLGRQVVLSTLLGEDDEGRRVRAVLDGAGVDVRPRAAVPATERHLNLMGSRGERLSFYLELPMLEAGTIDLDPRLREAIATAPAVVVDLADHARDVLREAARQGRPVWCDVHDYDGTSPFHREFVEAADHLFLSDERLPGHRELMTQRVAAGARVVVCTHGARGAIALTAQDGWIEVPAVRDVEVVDTNGAGDAFFTGFLDAHLRGAGTLEAMRAATRHAARCVQSPDLAPAPLRG